MVDGQGCCIQRQRQAGWASTYPHILPSATAFYQLTPRQQGKVQRYLGMPDPINFCHMAGRPQGKLTAGVRRALREMLRLAKGL